MRKYIEWYGEVIKGNIAHDIVKAVLLMLLNTEEVIQILLSQYQVQHISRQYCLLLLLNITLYTNFWPSFVLSH